MRSQLFDEATFLAAFLLFDVVLVIWLVIRCSRATGTPPPAAPQPVPQPPCVATHEAQLVDVNNVRGRTHFSCDVDEICCSLCRWASAEPAGSLVVLEVDHGPKLQAFVLDSKGLDGRVVVCFAGPKLEADDTIVRGIEFCRSRGERVLAVTSDCGLRGRCSEAAKGEGEAASPLATAREAKQARRRKGLRPLRGHTWVAFESSATLATLLPDNSAARRGVIDDIDTLLLGPTPRSEAAAAAARWRRRERSAKKMELTADRAEQAAVLYARLREAVAAGRAAMPTEGDAPGGEGCDGGGGGGDGATPAQKARASAVAHAAWVNAGCRSEKEERYAADRAAARRVTG